MVRGSDSILDLGDWGGGGQVRRKRSDDRILLHSTITNNLSLVALSLIAA